MHGLYIIWSSLVWHQTPILSYGPDILYHRYIISLFPRTKYRAAIYDKKRMVVWFVRHWSSLVCALNARISPCRCLPDQWKKTVMEMMWSEKVMGETRYKRVRFTLLMRQQEWYHISPVVSRTPSAISSVISRTKKGTTFDCYLRLDFISKNMLGYSVFAFTNLYIEKLIEKHSQLQMYIHCRSHDSVSPRHKHIWDGKKNTCIKKWYVLLSYINRISLETWFILYS